MIQIDRGDRGRQFSFARLVLHLGLLISGARSHHVEHVA